MNYSEWPRRKLVKECEMLREALHKLSKEATQTYIEKKRLQDQFDRLELTRAVFGG